MTSWIRYCLRGLRCERSGSSSSASSAPTDSTFVLSPFGSSSSSRRRPRHASWLRTDGANRPRPPRQPSGRDRPPRRCCPSRSPRASRPGRIFAPRRPSRRAGVAGGSGLGRRRLVGATSPAPGRFAGGFRLGLFGVRRILRLPPGPAPPALGFRLGLPGIVRCLRGGAFGRRVAVFLVGLGALGFGFGLKQRLPVGQRDLVVVGMDFREGEEAVPVSAVVDERGLQRGLDPRHLRQIDVSAQLLLVLRFEVEFLYAVSANDDDASLFFMRRVDKHFFCHGRCAPRQAIPLRRWPAGRDCAVGVVAVPDKWAVVAVSGTGPEGGGMPGPSPVAFPRYPFIPIDIPNELPITNRVETTR